MPCGSTIDDSTHALDAVSASFPAFRWSWKTPFAWLAGIALWWERRSQYRELLELDDRLLADIGVSKTDVDEVRRSPLYLDAWRDSR
jgi:uncharacterized protein YjiS (DUF1127 family)